MKCFYQQAIAPNMSYKSVNLQESVKKMLSERSVPPEAIDAELGTDQAADGASVGKVLQVLRDRSGLYSFFIEGKLYVGLAFYRN
jgi:hypothetical protein